MTTPVLDAAERAEMEVVRIALARGWLSTADLRSALLLREALRRAGQPAHLLRLLAARGLDPAHLPALREVHASVLRDATLPRGAGLEPLAPAEVPPELLQRSMVLAELPPEQDPAEVQQFILESRAAPAPSRPEKVGRYELLGELGRGGMGVVHRARDPELGREVALKLIQVSPGAELEDVQRFRIEAQVAAALRHPNLVAVHDWGVDQGRVYLVMDLVEGESLRALVRKEGPLDPRQAARIAECLARGLAEAHRQGVLHRDVKPANVLLGRDGEPRLTDFGLAKRVQADSGLTATGAVMGTPAYMPPEQARGERVDPRADVYALGATLYELLTGRPPFEGNTALEVITALLHRDPTPPDQVRPGLDRELAAVA